MQRSVLLASALVAGAGATAYVFLGETAAAVALAGAALGVGAALALGRRRGAPAKAKARKVPRSAPGRVARATAVAVSTVPAGRVLTTRPSRPAAAARRGPQWEAGAAMVAPQRQELRLTHDILTGMATGGKTTRGMCSACGATLWLSARRPVKARCPSCGHTRVLER